MLHGDVAMTAALPLPAHALAELEHDVPLDTLRLLTRTALTAVATQQLDEATLIADGLQPCFGHYLAVAMASATVATATNRPAEALSKLETLVKLRPDMDGVVCACALLKKEMGLSGWRSLAQRVIDSDGDEDATRLAREMLGTNVKESVPPPAIDASAVLRFA
jgi:hypothetical protein